MFVQQVASTAYNWPAVLVQFGLVAVGLGP